MELMDHLNARPPVLDWYPMLFNHRAISTLNPALPLLQRTSIPKKIRAGVSNNADTNVKQTGCLYEVGIILAFRARSSQRGSPPLPSIRNLIRLTDNSAMENGIKRGFPSFRISLILD